MPDSPLERLDIRGGRLGVNLGSGAVQSAVRADEGLDLVADSGHGGLLRLALPLDGYGSHYLETGTHGDPAVERLPDGLRLVFPRLASDHVSVPVRVELELRSAPEGLVVSARVHNGSDLPIPQVAFPQLLGLAGLPGDEAARVGLRASAAGQPPRIAVTGSDETRLRLSRGTVWPLRQLSMRPDDASFLETPLQRYYGYGAFEFSMKWLDYGDSHGGLHAVLAGPPVCRPGPARRTAGPGSRDDVNLRWLHFPTIAPGESWESGDFVSLLHRTR